MNNLNKIEEICVKYRADYRKNEILAPYTTFKIGGACDILVRINSVEVLSEAVKYCKSADMPYHVIGKGSNILVSDGGVRGAVLLLGSDFTGISVSGGIVSCQAGAALSSVCVAARDHSLSGLEFAYGIPGSVGGAVFMNAGAYGGEVSDVFLSCDYLDESGGFLIKTLERGESEFSYRKSPFTGTRNIILSAKFKLNPGGRTKISADMDDFMLRRKTKQPLEYPSAGSTFKRPPGDYASRLIDICGLKGLSAGGAEVSEKHAGFIVNKGGASCGDVLTLIEAVRERVFKETGITLEKEVEVIS